MRFCPFCAQENSDDVSECAHCGRRLPQIASQKVAAPTPTLPPRPPAVRPLPRARVVAPAPALPVAAPVAPPIVGGPMGTSAAPVAVVPEVSPNGSDRGRARTLLGVPAARPIARTEPPDNATRVDPSPFDGPTTQTPKLETSPGEETTSPSERLDHQVSEITTTNVRLPAPSPIEEDVTSVRDEEPTRAGDDGGPTDVHTALPPARTIMGRSPASARAQRPPPAPLPPPPARAQLPFREDPLELATNPHGVRLPPAEAPLAPVAPMASEALESEVGAADPPPMPAVPAPGLLPAVKYLIPLARAIWARHIAQKALRARLHGDQRLVDDTLHDLGRAAWQEPNRPGELRSELERADEDDERRRNEEKELARLDMSIATERERHVDDEATRKQAIASREAEVARLAGELADKRRAQKAEEKTLREAEARVGGAEKRVAQLVAKAARAEITPPEKGGGPNAAANFRKEAEAAQREVDALRPERDAAQERLRDLDAPITELDGQLADERGKLAEELTALEVARRDHKATLASFEAQKTEHDGARVIAEKSIRLRLVSTGTLLSLHRLDAPKLVPIYARLDELQATVGAREARISRLEAERHSYDKGAMQRGLVVVGSATGIFVILLVVVLVLLAR